MLIKLMLPFIRLYYYCTYGIEKYLGPLLLLVLRAYAANIFFKSGWSKLKHYLTGEWYKTIFLFTHVHPVPFLSPKVAALLGTVAEVAFPFLLFIGLWARISAVGLLGVTAVIIGFVHYHPTHAFWILLLFVIFIFGPGKISLDYLLHKKCAQRWIRRHKLAVKKSRSSFKTPPSLDISNELSNLRTTIDSLQNNKEPSILWNKTETKHPQEDKTTISTPEAKDKKKTEPLQKKSAPKKKSSRSQSSSASKKSSTMMSKNKTETKHTQEDRTNISGPDAKGEKERVPNKKKPAPKKKSAKSQSSSSEEGPKGSPATRTKRIKKTGIREKDNVKNLPHEDYL